MDHNRATEVLNRFDQVVTNVAYNLAGTFPTITTVEDAAQDARILLLSYAGFVPGGRHAGRLADIERITDGNDKRIRRLLTTQLRLDLSQDYGRETEKQMSTVSLDHLPEGSYSVFTDRVGEDIKPKDYPYLHAHYVAGMTGAEIAEVAGVGRSTVTRRIAVEKYAFVLSYVKRSGLVVEGDETTDELIEAYANLKAADK